MNPSFTSPLQRIQHTADIGRMVRAQRRSQGLRIDDAAALTQVSVDLLSRLENGKGSVGLDKLLGVLDGMGLCLIVGPKSDPAVRELLRAQPPAPD
jgi:transcriptional regulator with XRE-family HTH domain|nr:helix-turn-helix domain-containing protein [uncultured Albidiferax sp.]